MKNSHHNNYYHGHRGYYPYRYHRYTPYHYGVYWHPVGFFVAVMVTTAVIVSVSNQSYYYDQGVYYTQVSGGYTVVPAPVNIVVVELPDGVEMVPIDNTVTVYYFSGTFYTKTDDGYKVIVAPDGAIVTNIPEGGEEEEIGGQTYVVYNGVYFQPLSQDGKDVYQVVEMEATD